MAERRELVPRRSRFVRAPLLPATSRAGAAIGLVVIGAVHLHLYAGEEYDRIPVIGWLFLLTVIGAFVLAAVVLLSRSPLAGLAAAGFAAGVLGGYVLSLALPGGIFSFKEAGVSYSGAVSMAAELAVPLCGLRSAWLARAGSSLRGVDPGAG